ncbi:MAG: metal dependent hydrolase [Oscillospiraceae bacterium]|jgi:glyoxylase-like metal-dependent hydrolase (beta-lactamase superfamily II)|nr:metal dependent hydrolase [Oscillospiraceae bacterium]
MNEVIILEIPFTFGNRTDTIYPVILKDSSETILVDCGYPNFLSKIKEAAYSKNISMDEITKIIITHHDYDHMGALAEFKRMYPDLKICASKEQAPFISGKEKSLRLRQAEEMFEFLPENQKEKAKKLQHLFGSVEPAQVDVILEEHSILPWCGGIEVVPTPGHMPGHISLYLKEFKILISGDALATENGKIGIANPQYTLDMSTAKKSIEKLLRYDIQKILCYHGGIFEGDIKQALSQIIADD